MGRRRPNKRAHAPGPARLLHAPVEKLLDLPVAAKVSVNILLRLGLAGARAARQAERTQAVNHAVIDGLGHAPVLVRLQPGRHAENFLRRARVDVLIARKGFDQPRVLGHMGEHPQLDLRIVGGDQLPAGLRDERRANPQAEFIADGNVLEIRIRGRKPARARHRLIEAGVQAARGGIDVTSARRRRKWTSAWRACGTR